MRGFPTGRAASLALVGAIALLASGCQDYADEEQAEYDRTYAALSEVMARHFDVRESEAVENHIIARSRVGNQFGEQQRIVVEGWVEKDTHGFFVPRIQALDEMNMAVVNPGANPRGQQGQQWRAVSFNRTLEAELVNEVYEVLHGHPNSWSPDWYIADTELIDRQRRIEEARAQYRAREMPPPAPTGDAAAGGTYVPQPRTTQGGQ